MEWKVENQKGIALIVALLMILAFSVLGIAAINITNVETKITSNTRTSKQAFYLAEAGLEVAREKLRKSIAEGSPLSTELNSVKGADGLLGSGDDVSFVGTTSLGAGTFTVALTNDPAPGDGISTLSDTNNKVAFTSTGYGLDNSKAVIQTVVQTSSTGSLNPAFSAGILTNGYLDVNGSSIIQSNIQANSTISFNGASVITGDLSAHSTVTLKGATVVNGTPTQYAPLVDVPSVTTEVFNSLRTKAQASGIYYNGGQTYNGAGNLGAKAIFCDGNLTVNGNFVNGSIVATGNVTMNGSSQINGGVLDVAVVAGGNITMNGASSSYGAFWSNGSFVQNGASTITGSIVSVGNITRNGSFNFVSNNNIHNDSLPQTPTNVTVSVVSWKQL